MKTIQFKNQWQELTDNVKKLDTNIILEKEFDTILSTDKKKIKLDTTEEKSVAKYLDSIGVTKKSIDIIKEDHNLSDYFFSLKIYIPKEKSEESMVISLKDNKTYLIFYFDYKLKSEDADEFFNSVAYS